jgi:hypothetical protein
VTTLTDHAVVRPRKASAGTRRRHKKYLPFSIRQVVADAHTVLILPIEHDGYEPHECEFTAFVRDRAGNQLTLAAGSSRRLAVLLQSAFPGADWASAQTWRADTNQLATWQAPNVLGRWGW